MPPTAPPPRPNGGTQAPSSREPSLNSSYDECEAAEEAFYLQEEGRKGSRGSLSDLRRASQGPGGSGAAGPSEDKNEGQRQPPPQTPQQEIQPTPKVQSPPPSRGQKLGPRGASSPPAGERYTSQMDLILTAGRRTAGRRTGGKLPRSSSGGGAAPDRNEAGRSRSRKYAEERRMKIEFQRGGTELGHPSSPSSGNLSRDRSASAASSSYSETGAAAPAAPTLLLQNPEFMAGGDAEAAGEVPHRASRHVANDLHSPDLSANTDSARTVPPNLLFWREASVGTQGTANGSTTTDDGDGPCIYENEDPQELTRSDSGYTCKMRRIQLLIDACEMALLPFKKKLILTRMKLTAAEIPLRDICCPGLCQGMIKLSLAGNPLGYVPDDVVQKLTGLRTLDLSQCNLHVLPKKWDLPHLKRLDLSHNKLVDFPDEKMLIGIPELQHLDMYGNKVVEITLPQDSKVLSKLDHLNMGYNDLAALPDDMDSLLSLRTLKIMNNFIEKIPERICNMGLRVTDVSSNPLIQPPIETCERGICSMRRYYACLKLEERSRRHIFDKIQTKKECRVRERKRSKLMKKRNEALASFAGFVKKKSENDNAESDSFSTTSSSTPSMTMAAGINRISTSSVASGRPTRSAASTLPPSRSSPALSRSSEAQLKEDGPVLRSKTMGDQFSDVSSAGKKPSPNGKFEKDVERRGGKYRRKEGLLGKIPFTRRRTGDDSAERDVFGKQDQGKQRDFPDSPMAAVSTDTAEELLVEGAEVENMLSDTINNMLKVIFVGMAMTGKTSIIKRLIEGKDGDIPKVDERTVGVDIYEWDPKTDGNTDRGHIDTSIKIEDGLIHRSGKDVDVKFSLWDFAGQHVYHATHELFFSPRALYVLVWDMGCNNPATKRPMKKRESDHGAFSLAYDSSDDEDDPLEDDAAIKADRALERDIDEKVQFWVDCIQSSAPGAAIMPVASFDDYFDDFRGANADEASRRCTIMRERLIMHEQRRIQGLKDRLNEYELGNLATSEAAIRLRKLLSPFSRPKLIFGGEGNNSVVRISGTKYTGFDRLSEKLVNIATGRDRAGWDYSIFRGHVGARIPRMRLEVRDAVREMRDRFKVVEWGYFINTLKKKGIHNVDDVSDALHFLTNVGELSYFGDVVKDFGKSRMQSNGPEQGSHRDALTHTYERKHEVDEDYVDEDAVVYPMDEVNEEIYRNEDAETASLTASTSSMSTDSTATGLSQFIFLNPRWLVAAVACILRHDLSQQINQTRRQLNKQKLLKWDDPTLNGNDFYLAHLNCPIVTTEDACMLWQAKKIINKAVERAVEHSDPMAMSPLGFLQRLLIRFRVFVPIDLNIDKACLGGTDYGRDGESIEVDEATSIELNGMTAHTARFFFLPSLLGSGEASDVWSYKNSDSWKTTISHCILFPDGVPPGLMERITATVLSDIYTATKAPKRARKLSDCFAGTGNVKGRRYSMGPQNYDPGYLRVKEILCWRSSFYLKLGMEVTGSKSGDVTESIVEIYCSLLDQDSHLCVSSDFMGAGARRLVLSGKGQVGQGGAKIWQGGYTLVIRAIGRVMEEYGGLEFEKQAVCPECLAKRPVSRACLWDLSLLRAAARNGDETMRCQFGHRIETRLITGICAMMQMHEATRMRQLAVSKERLSDRRLLTGDPILPVTELLRGVVVVGLYDGNVDKIVRVGTGFIADKKRGLIVTASHTLMNIWGDKQSPYGENYHGLRKAKVVIGIIPREGEEGDSDRDRETTAVFRYFATIVAKDESIDKDGVCHMDACLLRITTKLEQDVKGDGSGLSLQPEILLMNNPAAMKQERLHQLRVSNREAELDEQVRILGYNQGGEGLMTPGMHVNRIADFARGYVVMKFHTNAEVGSVKGGRFKPKAEIVVMCPTIGGHSGGPCVNQSGEVIGILSRADPTERQRCYLVPASSWRGMVKRAKQIIQ